MRPSFVRKGAAAAADPGTRPGLHGQTLISMGLVDMDRLLGGGIPLGSLVLLLEDKHSGQHLHLMRYFLAEGVVIGQKTLWMAATQPPGGPAAFLPAQATPSDASKASSASSSSSTSAPHTKDGEQEPELRIAWQYRKYIQENQQQRQQEAAASSKTGAPGAASSSSSSGGAAGAAPSKARPTAAEQGAARAWCHTFDLTRSMDQAVVDKAGMVFTHCSGPCGLGQARQAACQFARQFSPPPPGPGGMVVPVARGPGSVGRVVIQSLGASAWGCEEAGCRGLGGEGGDALEGGVDEATSWQAMAASLFALRCALQDTRCVAVVTVQADQLPPSWLLRMQHLADAVVALDTLTSASPVFKLLPDAASAAALLTLRKLPAAGMLGPRLSDPQVHVVRYKRKRLTITAVEIDPDAEARQQDAANAASAAIKRGTLVPGVGAGGAGAKSGGARTAGGAGALEF